MNKKTTFSQRLQRRMDDIGIKGVDITKKTGVTSGAMSQWLNYGIKPKGKNLLIIADLLKCSPEWLLTGKGSPNKSESNVLPADLIEKKVIGSVSAGNLKELIEMDLNGDLETVYLPRKYLDDNKYFVLKIDGDSMTSDKSKHSFNDGNFMVFDKQIAATSGDYALVYNEHDKTSVFKKLVKDGNTYLLQPLNPAYPTRLMSNEEVVIGVAVCYQPKSEFLK